ncbi:hypothetical protein, partial [Falsiroseomonas sp. E2-1-a20]|uniref:hypothetical protein n=1 Tax=Falsiroseomonas sp. E2-1-a20 TaxID=3239300 RepID=UPI003F2B1D0A
ITECPSYRGGNDEEHLSMKGLIAAATLAATLLSSSLAMANTTPIADLRRGTMVTVVGIVDRILDTDEFRLRDPSGTIRVYVGPNWVPADVGERVTVRGFVDDDLIKEIYARELVRADGSTMRFERRYE